MAERCVICHAETQTAVERDERYRPICPACADERRAGAINEARRAEEQNALDTATGVLGRLSALEDSVSALRRADGAMLERIMLRLERLEQAVNLVAGRTERRDWKATSTTVLDGAVELPEEDWLEGFLRRHPDDVVDLPEDGQ
jgi:hypothetical protein